MSRYYDISPSGIIATAAAEAKFKADYEIQVRIRSLLWWCRISIVNAVFHPSAPAHPELCRFPGGSLHESGAFAGRKGA